MRVTRRTMAESLLAMALTPAGSVSAGDHHEATVERQRASASGDCVCRTAHSSHRNSAASQSRARARRLSGWKNSARSRMSTAMRHSGSRRTTCATSCASAARCCSGSKSSRKRSGRTMCRPPRASGTGHIAFVVSGSSGAGWRGFAILDGVEQIRGRDGYAGAERPVDPTQSNAVPHHSDEGDEQPGHGGDRRPTSSMAGHNVARPSAQGRAVRSLRSEPPDGGGVAGTTSTFHQGVADRLSRRYVCR